GVDDAFLGLAGGSARAGAGFAAAPARAGLLVHRLAALHGGLRQRLDLVADRLRVAARHDAAQRRDIGLHAGLHLRRGLVAQLRQRLLGRVDQRVGLVARLDQLAPLLVLGAVRLGVLHHLLDLGLRQAARRLDADLLLLAGRLVLRGHVQDAVRVDVERDLDLRYATRRRRDARQLEAADGAVVRGHGALTLQHMDLDGRLVVL